MYDASKRKDVRKAEKAARLSLRDDRDAIVKIMGDTFGRSWMWRKLEEARVFSDPFSGDALLEAYNKGFRNFGMALLFDITTHCPEQYIQMTREANERHASSTAASRDPASAEYSGSSATDGGTQAGSEYDPFTRDEADDDGDEARH